MRAIHLAKLDTVRPILVLTRDVMRPYLSSVTVVPITSTVPGISTEVLVGVDNGLKHESVVNCDGISTIPREQLMQPIGFLLPRQELALRTAITLAFDLD